MKIGIIGSGNMGQALGTRFAQLGHAVFFGARRLEQARSAAAGARAAQFGSNDGAAGFGSLLVWTMREGDPSAVLSDPRLLDGKIVLDVNNRDYAIEARTGGWFAQAIAERLQAAASGACVVKALNTIARETFDTDPAVLRATGAQTFVAGRDASAKQTVGALAGELGFEAVDVGDSAAAMRAVEALGDVIRLIMIDGGRGARAHLRLTRLPEPQLNSIGQPKPSNYR